MCLGIPAQLVAGETGHQDLVMATVGGVPRPVNIGLLDERPTPGDWILVHMGFALNTMTAEEARDAVDALGAERRAEDHEAAAMQAAQAAMDAAAQAEEEARDAVDALGAERRAEHEQAGQQVGAMQAAMDAAAQAEEDAIAARWMS